jgi:hypothetical protein
MKLSLPVRRCNVSSIGLGCALFIFWISTLGYAERQQNQSSQSPPAQQQQDSQTPVQPSPQPPDPSAPKPKKIWTNDEVITLRSPADTYLAEKEAQEAADAKAAEKKAELAKQIKEASLTMTLPSTPEETQRQIKAREERIGDMQAALDRLNKDLLTTADDQKGATQKQIDQFTVNLQKAQLELKVLQDHLQRLTKTPSSELPGSPTVPPTPPSLGNFE